MDFFQQAHRLLPFCRISFDLDYRLQRYCKLKQIQFSRYADDLTFSSDLEFTEVQRQKITDIIQSFNFEINPEKVYIKKQGSKQLVIGIVVNQKVNIERKMLKKVRAMLDILNKSELETAAAKHFKHDKDSKKDAVPSFLNQLAGYINFIGQVRGKKDDLYLRYKTQFKHQLALKKVKL